MKDENSNAPVKTNNPPKKEEAKKTKVRIKRDIWTDEGRLPKGTELEVEMEDALDLVEKRLAETVKTKK